MSVVVVVVLALGTALALAAWRRQRFRRRAARALAVTFADEIERALRALERSEKVESLDTSAYTRHGAKLENLVPKEVGSAVETFYRALSDFEESERILRETTAPGRKASLGDSIRAKDRFDALRGSARMCAQVALEKLESLRRVGSVQ